MAQTASTAVPAPPAAQALPLESFLATDDPVWVWDGQGRRILWANSAGAKLWGDPTPERLRRRRTGKTPNAPARLTALARSTASLNDHVESLRVPSANGPVTVPCVFQRLKLAGDRPGLVVRALPERDNAETSAEIALHPAVADGAQPTAATQTSAPSETATARKSATPSDFGALRAIARDIDDASRRGQPDSGTSQKRNPVARTTSGSKRSKTRQKKATPPPARGRKTSSETTHGPAAPLPASPSSTEMAGLLARVSHEIRNPLTIILGFAEILMSDRLHRLPEGKAQEYASDIYRTAQLALGLADDLLGFAERVEGSGPPPHAWMDLNTLVADCLHLLEPVAEAQSVTLTRRLKRDAPQLLAHERSIRQILLNLLMNALRHGDGGQKIRVMTRLDKDGGLVLSVKDNGPGMTPEQIAAAKAPEQAGDVKAAGRRGLGLRLVRGFVSDNHGELDIFSKPGEGTDVRIRFGPDRLRAPKPQRPKRKPQKRKRK